MEICSPLEGFVYPVGYRPTSAPISDPAVLEAFEPFEHPYVVICQDGKSGVDPNAPVAVRRLRHRPCPNLSSLLRYLEAGGLPDEAMQATYRFEDALDTACDYSQAGFHRTAIKMIRSLPMPFQKTGDALSALVESLTALEDYQVALHEVRLLLETRAAPTQWSLTLHQLEEVNLLMLLGGLEEAQGILDKYRVRFQEMYQYFGARAALALSRDDNLLAQLLIVQAGRVAPYHSYKLLWNPLLKPLETFIRDQLLTSEGEPRLPKLDSEIRRIAARIQGALLLGQREEARTFAEAMIPHHMTDWSTTEEVLLAWAGVGRFELLYRTATVLPGEEHGTNRLAKRIGEAIADKFEFKQTEELIKGNSSLGGQFVLATSQLRRGSPYHLPPTFERLLVEVGGSWNEADRDLVTVYFNSTGFLLTRMREPRRRRSPESRGEDIRTLFPVVEIREMADVFEVENWIEEKLVGNVGHVHNNAYRAPWEIHIDGWTLLAALKPTDRTPLLKKAWVIATTDPNFYFKNGPASSFGQRSSFAIRFLTMLSVALA